MSLNRGLVAAFAASVLMFALPATALELGWSGGPMSASGDTIRTEGDLVNAIAQGIGGPTYTVNGVTFVGKTDSTDTGIDFRAGGSPGYWNAPGAPAGLEGDYASLLGRGWWIPEGDGVLKLSGLQVGKTYLVQLFMCSTGNGKKATAYAPGSETLSVKLSGDGWTYGGTFVGVFVAKGSTESLTIRYAGDKGFLNGYQLRDVSSIPMVVNPEVGAVSARAHVGKVTVSLSGVALGTDAKCDPATSYSVFCAVDGGEAKAVLENQVRARAAFDLEDLEDGEHACTVWIKTDKDTTTTPVELAFDTEIPLGWTAEPMSDDGDTVATDGDLVFAYDCVNDVTVNGVPFKGISDFGTGEFSVPSDKFYRDNNTYAVPAPLDSSEGYGKFLSRGFWCRDGEEPITIKGLEPGETYLLQLVSYCPNNGRTGQICAPEDDETFILPSGDGWTYGGTLTDVFTASAAEMVFMFNVKKTSVVNAIQLRKFKGAPKVIEPSVGTLAAKAKGTTATVTLAGVDLGTDDKGIPATSYSVSYRLDDGDEILALEDRTGATAAFQIGGLTDGEYTCSVTITTSAGKTTEAKSVSFIVNTSIGDFDALKEAIESASQGQTVTVEKGTYYATSTISVPKGVAVVSAGGPGVTVIDGGYPELTNRVFNVNGSRVTISGLTFQNVCSADRGGAIYANNNYHFLTITNCVFENCHAKSGGAVGGSPYYGDYGAETQDGPIPERGSQGVISGCTFVDCEAYGTTIGDNESAGAVFGAFWFENSTFDNCTAYGISSVLFSSQHMMITNCTFKNCPDVQKGSRGAIFVDRQKINLMILDSTFVGMNCNKIFGTQNGNGYLTLDRCAIDNCAGEASTSDNPEWKLMDRGIVRNSLIRRNKKPFSVFDQAFENCTIVDNVGGFFIKFQDGKAVAKAAFTNCVWANNIKWENGAYSKGCVGFCWHGAGQDENVHTGLSFSHCAFNEPSEDAKMALIFGQDPTGTTEELTRKVVAKGPRFADPENGDWTLKMSSPLKDTGVLCDWMTGAIDLAGNPRVVDMPDIGCYEHMKKGLLLLVR